MPAPSYTLLDILTAVKEEGRVNRTTELDNMIKRTINEVMVKHSRNKKYPELFVPAAIIAIATDKQNAFAIPTAFTQVVAVRYFSTASNDYPIYLNKANQFSLPFRTGYPAYWYIAGSMIYVYPNSQVVAATDSMEIDYFKLPNALVADADPLIVDDMYPIILQECLSRVRRYHDDTAGDDRFAAGAKEAETTVNDQP